MEDKTWALINNEEVVNTAVGSDEWSKSILENFDQILDITNVDPVPGVGWKFFDGSLRPPKPFNSWVWDESLSEWSAPSEKPEDGKEYEWDEYTTSWIEKQ